MITIFDTTNFESNKLVAQRIEISLQGGAFDVRMFKDELIRMVSRTDEGLTKDMIVHPRVQFDKPNL